MHDIDRTQLEYGSEVSEYGEIPELASEQYEATGELRSVLGSLFGEAQAEGAFAGGSQEFQELPEMMHDELASELMEVSSEQELDHFLGNLRTASLFPFRRLPCPLLGLFAGISH